MLALLRPMVEEDLGEVGEHVNVVALKGCRRQLGAPAAAADGRFLDEFGASGTGQDVVGCHKDTSASPAYPVDAVNVVCHPGQIQSGQKS